MCVEQGQHNPRKDYPWHPLCHGFIRYADDYFSVESCRSSSSSSPCRCGTGHATLPMFPAASVAVITASPGPTRKRLILGPRSSSSSSLPTNRIPGLAVGLILMISPSTSTVPPSVIRSEEHTSELQSRLHLVCRLLLEKKNNTSSTSPFLSSLSRTRFHIVVSLLPQQPKDTSTLPTYRTHSTPLF